MRRDGAKPHRGWSVRSDGDHFGPPAHADIPGQPVPLMVEYLELLVADLWAALAWMGLGAALTLAALWRWRIEISHLMTHPKSGLVLPGEHVVTHQASLQEIQHLSGK